MTTFTTAHFEGEWDKVGACPKKLPEKDWKTGWTEEEMRRIEREEAGRFGAEVLDVTEMAGQRPDGHPGIYMNEIAVGGEEKRVQSDCVHWCLPGPIDEWNAVLFQLLRRSHGEGRSEIGR